MKTKLLTLLFLLLAAPVWAQDVGYFVRSSCATLSPLANSTVCTQTTTTGGLTAGNVHVWNGSMWVVVGSIAGAGTGDIEGVTAGTNLTGGGTSGTVTLNVANPLVGNVTGNASTATALAADGTDCAVGQAPTGVDASGNATGCAAISGGAGPPVVLDLADDGANESAGIGEIAVTGDINSVFTEPSADKLLIDVGQNWPTADVAVLANAATALAANGANCSSGQFAQGTDASGNAEGCLALPTTITGTANQITASAATGPITLSIPSSPTLPGTTTGTFSGNLTGNVTGNVTGSSGSTTGNAATATALAANGANCSAGNSPLGVDASGAVESCFDVATQTELNTHGALTGTSAHGATTTNTASQIVSRDASGNFAAGTITATLSGNATTATTAGGLSANGANCSSGSAPLGVDSAGASESCFDVLTQAEHDAQFPDTPIAIASLPAAGTAGRLRWVNDATGFSCSDAAGSTLVLCYDNGADWVPASFFTQTTLGLDDLTSLTTDNADSASTALSPGNADIKLRLYCISSNECVIDTDPASNSRHRIMSGKTGGISTVFGSADMWTWNPEAASKLLMWEFPTAAYRPLKTAWVAAEALYGDGTQCPTNPSTVTINSGSPFGTFICTDNDGATLYGKVSMPKSWDGGTVTFQHHYIQTAADTGVLNGDIAASCRLAAATINNTWGTEVAIDDAAVTGSNALDITTSAAVTPNGTCTAGTDRLLQFRYQLDAAGTTTSVSTLHHVGFKIEYSVTSLSD